MDSSRNGQRQGRRPSIFIAMPNLGVLRTENALLLLQWFSSGRYRLKFFAPMHIRPHDRARNLCHREFLKEDYEYLFFLDADTVPPAEALDRLLAADKPMISATVQTLKMDDGEPRLIPVALRYDAQAGGYKPYWGRGIEKVDVTTCAATLIKREVLEAVGPRAFQFPFEDEWGTDGLGEDFYFCERVRAAGFTIWNDFGMLCSHYKELDTKAINRLLLISA